MIWSNGTFAAPGDRSPSSTFDPQRPAMEPVLTRIEDERSRSAWFGAGWDAIVLELDKALAAIDAEYVVHQAKEKFGTLRYYCSIERDPNGYRLISEAAGKSARTCERCGAPGALVKPPAGMWRTLCPTHTADHLHDGQVWRELARQPS